MTNLKRIDMIDPLRLIEKVEEDWRATDAFLKFEYPTKEAAKYGYVTMSLGFQLADALSELETLKEEK